MKASKVIYSSKKRPKLQTENKAYVISDISEMGLRFFTHGSVKVGHQMLGTVTLLCGESIDVEGMIVRKDSTHIHMNINIPVEKSILEKEQAFIYLNF